MAKNGRNKMVSVRTIVLVLVALTVAVGAGLLTNLTEGWPQAVLVGGAAFGGAVLFLDQVVE